MSKCFTSSTQGPWQLFPLNNPLSYNMVRNDLPPYLLSIFVCVSARPEEMCTGAHSSALVRFLQKFGCSKCTLSPQRFMILFTEALHPLKSTNDQGDGSQLCFGITDFIFIQRKCLVNKKRPLLPSIGALSKVPPTKIPILWDPLQSLHITTCWPLPWRGKRQLIKERNWQPATRKLVFSFV